MFLTFCDRSHAEQSGLCLNFYCSTWHNHTPPTPFSLQSCLSALYILKSIRNRCAGSLYVNQSSVSHRLTFRLWDTPIMSCRLIPFISFSFGNILITNYTLSNIISCLSCEHRIWIKSWNIHCLVTWTLQSQNRLKKSGGSSTDISQYIRERFDPFHSHSSICSSVTEDADAASPQVCSHLKGGRRGGLLKVFNSLQPISQCYWVFRRMAN